MMKLLHNWRWISGSAVWLGLIVLLASWLNVGFSANSGATTRELARFVASGRQRYELEFAQAMPVRAFDPIFLLTDAGEFVQVGAIERVVSEDSTSKRLESTDWARAEFFSNAPRLTDQHKLIYYQTPLSMDFVIQTIFTAEKRAEIAQLIARAYAQHHKEILRHLRPILERSIQQAVATVNQALLRSLERHRGQIDALGQRYRQELVEQELIPLISEEIWPIVYRESQPLAEQIGQELWQQASMWRFGWAYFYDATPLPGRNLLRREFERFVDDHGLPTLQSHVDDFIELQQTILAKVVRNPQVQQTLREAAQTAYQDPEVQNLILSILDDSLVNNDELKQLLRDYWESPQTQQMLRIADERLEPTVARIGELLFGNPNTAVTPEFARVLRAKVLRKDHRWYLLASEGRRQVDPRQRRIRVEIGGETHLNPFDYSLPQPRTRQP